MYQACTERLNLARATQAKQRSTQKQSLGEAAIIRKRSSTPPKVPTYLALATQNIHSSSYRQKTGMVFEWCAGKKDTFWWEQSAVNHLCARFQRELVCEHAQSTTPRSESSTKLPVLSYRKYPSVWTHRLGKINPSARTGSSYTEHCIRPSLDLRKSPP